MESSSFDLTVTPILKPIQPLSLENPFLDGFFSIHFHYNLLTISSTSNDPKNLIFNFRTLVRNNFLIPFDILCNYNEQTHMDDVVLNNLFVFSIFRDMSNGILDKLLSGIKECARNMVALNIEECGTLEMNVLLRRVTTLEVEEDGLDQYYQCSISQQNVGLSLKSVDETISNSNDKCSICLEELHNESQSKLFHTKCSHVFHKECIAQLIYGCINRSTPYSCPMCRQEIMCGRSVSCFLLCLYYCGESH
ncbi:putative chromatin regulator PHD family [Medicago truncatula]|nr:putative chromatin regulator PHD family [Medicago truncatula]